MVSPTCGHHKTVKFIPRWCWSRKISLYFCKGDEYSSERACFYGILFVTNFFISSFLFSIDNQWPGVQQKYFSLQMFDNCLFDSNLLKISLPDHFSLPPLNSVFNTLFNAFVSSFLISHGSCFETTQYVVLNDNTNSRNLFNLIVIMFLVLFFTNPQILDRRNF